MRPRLFLITPLQSDADRLAERIGAALAAGDVASVLVDLEPFAPPRRQKIAQSVVQVCAEASVAAIIRNDSQIAGRTGADGIHVDGEHEDLVTAVERFRPRHIVGAGRVPSRHEALVVGEMDVDYVFFGRIDRPEGAEADRAALDLAAWWSPIVEIPCVAMAAGTRASLEAALETGAEFIAVRALVWDDPDGPADAVRKANEIVDDFVS